MFFFCFDVVTLKCDGTWITPPPPFFFFFCKCWQRRAVCLKNAPLYNVFFCFVFFFFFVGVFSGHASRVRDHSSGPPPPPCPATSGAYGCSMLCVNVFSKKERKKLFTNTFARTKGQTCSLLLPFIFVQKRLLRA